MATNVNRTELAGSAVVTASIAVHTSYKVGEDWNERTDWFRLVAFGEAGEALSRFSKGERIRVVGRLQSSSYTDREGFKRTSVEVVVLRSEPAPLIRKADAAEPEAAEPLPAEPEAPTESADAPATKPRRRKKVAA